LPLGLTGRLDVRFRDRRDAGRHLAERLLESHWHDPVVLALPRGGVPVAFEIAKALGAPLDVVAARKVGAPGHPEFGVGAIGEGGAVVASEAALRRLGLTITAFTQLAAREQPELERQVQLYRGARVLPEMDDRDVVVVDDGFATGVTAEAALRSLARTKARRLVLAVPTCAPGAARRLAGSADDVVCLVEPTRFEAVGQAYEDFSQVTDEEVLRLLACANRSERVGP
jgi:putative phosphoribosyl transferase